MLLLGQPTLLHPNPPQETAMRWIFSPIKLVLKLLIAAFFIAVCALAVYVWRSYPTLDGTLQAPGLQAAVQVNRDAADVTHIEAANVRDAAFALGYVHAQERSWQLEFNRRLMHGELSELFGPQTLDTDRLMRGLGLMQAARAQWRGLSSDARAGLVAYADGINSFHASSRQALPPEFQLLRTKPGAWTAEDSVGWALMMALDLGGNWGNEFARLSAAQRLGTAQLWQLFPAYPGEVPASKTDFAKLYADLGVYRTITSSTTKTVANNAINTPANSLFSLYDGREIAAWAEGLGHVEGKGSNNWVVAGNYSTSGKPILANDPHLGLNAPAIWYFARLQAPAADGQPALDVIGATLPGLPGVVLGRTAGVAWGFTNTGPDVQDLYLERINPANPLQYQTPEGWAEFASRTETIKVKGQGDEVLTLRSTRHGPVMSDAQKSHVELLDTSKYVLALRWSALDPDNHTVAAGFKANFAQTTAELVAGFADHHSPMQNLVAADTTGQTIFKTIGKAPVRKKEHDLKGMAPAPGWDARYDWADWLSAAQNPGTPHADIAKKGWHASANQRIHAANYPYFLGQDWATPERFERIETLLAALRQQGGKHSLQTMRDIQADTQSLASQRLLPVLRATQSTHALAQTAQTALQSFSGDMRADSAAPLIFAAWADELARGLIIPKLGEGKFKAQYGKRHFRALVETVLRADSGVQASLLQSASTSAASSSTPMGNPMSAADAAAWCAPQTCTEQSSAALSRALDRLQARHGVDPATWRWGGAHFAHSAHRPFSNVAPLAKYFDVKAPTGGDPWTVNVGQYWPNDPQNPFANRHAASMRAMYDLADPENSVFIYQTGQSGLVWSPRYRDMSSEWAAVQYRPLRLAPTDWAHQLSLTP
jgi:penicillin G amidase